MNICFFYGQGNINFNFDKYADPYFIKTEKILGISKSKLIKGNYIYKYQLLSLISNISLYYKLVNKFKINKSNLVLVGYSLGEYSALVCSNSISFEQCIQLIKFRSEIMYECGKDTNSIMITIIGIEEKFLNVILSDYTFYISIYLSQNSYIVSIKRSDLINIKKILTQLKKFNKIFFKELIVDGGFHSPFMDNSTEKFSKYIGNLNINLPDCRVLSNYDNKFYSNIITLKKNLVLHLNSSINWKKIINKLFSNDINKVFELGGSKIKKIISLNNIQISMEYIIIK